VDGKDLVSYQADANEAFKFVVLCGNLLVKEGPMCAYMRNAREIDSLLGRFYFLLGLALIRSYTGTESLL